MGGSSGGSSTTRVRLPDWLSYSLKDASDSITGKYESLPQGTFPGPFNATRTGFDDQALSLGKNFADSVGGLGPAVQNYGMDLLGGKYLDFASRPEYQNFVNTGIYQPLERSYRDVILPQVRSQSIDSGAFGGSRNAVAEMLAYREPAQTAAETAARAGLEMFGRERQMMNLAPTLLQQGAQLSALPSEAYAKLGQYERQLQDLGISNEKAAFEESISGPFRQDIAFLNALAPIVGAYGGGTQTKIDAGGSKAGGALVGGLGGAAAGLGLAAALSTNPLTLPLGIAAALGGGALGAGASFL